MIQWFCSTSFLSQVPRPIHTIVIKEGLKELSTKQPICQSTQDSAIKEFQNYVTASNFPHIHIILYIHFMIVIPTGAYLKAWKKKCTLGCFVAEKIHDILIWHILLRKNKVFFNSLFVITNRYQINNSLVSISVITIILNYKKLAFVSQILAFNSM